MFSTEHENNSFGYGGTNAHVILDSARDSVIHIPNPLNTPEEDVKPARANRHRLFVISAASEKSCRMVANNLARYLVHKADSTNHEDLLDRLAYTLSRRSFQKHRASLISSDLNDLIYQLTTVAQNSIPAGGAQKEPRIAFVFSGQGAQYYNMGRELIQRCTPFTRSLERANQQLSTLGCSWDIMAELQKSDATSLVDEPAFGQPLSTAIQLALVDTLATLGVSPCAVAGHSSGEIAAAYCSNALSFEDAMTVSYHRGRLTGKLLKVRQKQPGAMLAVGASPDSVEEYIQTLGDDYSHKVRIACYNSPSSVTVSGDNSTIDQLSEMLKLDDVFNRKLKTNGAAYHSAFMREIEKEYYDSLQNLTAPTVHDTVTMVSSLTGKEISGKIIDRNYWVKNLLSPVLFTDATKILCEGSKASSNVDIIIEIGPHSQLGGKIYLIQNL